MRIDRLCLPLAVLAACGADGAVRGPLTGTGADAGAPSSGGVIDAGGEGAADGAGGVTDAAGQEPSEASSTRDGALAVDAAGVDCSAPATYDETVLCDHPAAFWAMSHLAPLEPDLTGNGNAGSYQGGAPAPATMPNGDRAADFDGASGYLTVPSNASFSIPTAGELTWEAWLRPDALQFPHDDGVDGYVDWMGKCDRYSPTCEWAARMYDASTKVVPNRCNRLSAYAFNSAAGLGSGAYWQPTCGLLQAGDWYHVVGLYTTKRQPADCPSAPGAPGAIDIWVNGVEWSQADHSPTGCMSQYSVVPAANGSPLNIGTVARDSWFAGAIGKVAIYGYLLDAAQIAAHFEAMSARAPTGSCADTCTL